MFLEDELILTVKTFSFAAGTNQYFASMIDRDSVLEILVQVNTDRPVVTYFGTDRKEADKHFNNFVQIALATA